MRSLLLLVNDLAQIRSIHERHLRAAEFDVLSAGDAVTLIDLALQSHPRAILIDDALPRSSAWEALEVLQKHPSLRGIPRILIGWLIAGTFRAARLAGAQGFVPKPCAAADLVREVRRVLA